MQHIAKTQRKKTRETETETFQMTSEQSKQIYRIKRVFNMRRKKKLSKINFFSIDEGCVFAFEYEWAKNDLIKVKM